MRRECRERFPRHRGLAITTCITARVLCMPGSLTSGSLWSRWRGTRSRLSQCMHNLQFGISGKWPINSFDEYYDLKIVNGLAEGMPVYQQDLFQYIYFFQVYASNYVKTGILLNIHLALSHMQWSMAEMHLPCYLYKDGASWIICLWGEYQLRHIVI